jgi:hypothetical protein
MEDDNIVAPPGVRIVRVTPAEIRATLDTR